MAPPLRWVTVWAVATPARCPLLLWWVTENCGWLRARQEAASPHVLWRTSTGGPPSSRSAGSTHLTPLCLCHLPPSYHPPSSTVCYCCLTHCCCRVCFRTGTLRRRLQMEKESRAPCEVFPSNRFVSKTISAALLRYSQDKNPCPFPRQLWGPMSPSYIRSFSTFLLIFLLSALDALKILCCVTVFSCLFCSEWPWLSLTEHSVEEEWKLSE